MNTAIIILAAGKGTRMNSKYQKILHEVGGKPMVQHLFEAADEIATDRPILVVGPGETGVQELIGDAGQYVVQAERLGTGDATRVAEPLVNKQNKKDETAERVIVTYADMPLLTSGMLQKLVDLQIDTGAAVVMLSVMGGPESSFGRIVRNQYGHVIEICEVAEARRRPNAEQILNIREHNAGVYCFDADFIWSNIHDLPLRQARSGQEYYLTDLIEFAVQQGRLVAAVATNDPDECLGAGRRDELPAVEQAFRQRAVRKAMDAGVTIINPEQTYIDADVTIGQDSVIWPGTYIQGKTVIGEDCVIGPNTIVRSATIGAGSVLEQCVVVDAALDDGTTVMPFTQVIG